MSFRNDNPVVALIQARGGSKGVPGKNIRPLLGYPVLAWSIVACKLARSVDRVILSTDSEEIAEVAKRYGCEVPFMRPAELASDLATDKVVFEHALDLLQAEQNLTPELFVQVRPTTPLRSPNLIDAAVRKIRSNPNFTGLRSVYEMSETAWKGFETDHTGALVSLLEKSIREVRDGADAPRQMLPPTYIAQGFVDLVRPEFINTHGSMYGSRIYGFMTPDVGEIDAESDFDLLEFKFKKFGFGSEIFDFLSGNYPSE